MYHPPFRPVIVHEKKNVFFIYQPTSRKQSIFQINYSLHNFRNVYGKIIGIMFSAEYCIFLIYQLFLILQWTYKYLLKLFGITHLKNVFVSNNNLYKKQQESLKLEILVKCYSI